MIQNREEHHGTESAQQAFIVAEELAAKNARDMLVLDISTYAAYADALVIATATSRRHAQSLADSIVVQRKNALRQPAPMEGYAQGDWILVDFGNVIVNIFQSEVRKIFNLEGLWSGARILKDTRHLNALNQMGLEEKETC